MTETPPCRRRDCVACTTAAALMLLETGRPAMALALLREMPAAIREALGEAYAAGQHEGVMAAREAQRRKPKAARAEASARSRPPAGGSRPAFARAAAELRGHVERLGLARVAAVLGVRPDDMAALLEGRAEVAGSRMARLRRTAADG